MTCLALISLLRELFGPYFKYIRRRAPSVGDSDSLTPTWARLKEEAALGTHTHTIYAVRRVYSAAQWLRPSPVAHR
eukprot:scaffold92419_cov69-Phaeocystis_antarctica.AAC.1